MKIQPKKIAPFRGHDHAALKTSPKVLQRSIKKLIDENKVLRDIVKLLKRREEIYVFHLTRMEDALQPFADFIEKFDEKPLRLDDEFYAIHVGTEWEARLKLSDLRKAKEVLHEEMPR
jgi:hypothetical protein